MRELLSPDTSRMPSPGTVAAIVAWSALMVPVAIWCLDRGGLPFVIAMGIGFAPGLAVGYWQDKAWTAAGRPRQPLLLRVVAWTVTVCLGALVAAIAVQRQSGEILIALVLLGSAVGTAAKYTLLRLAIRDTSQRPA